MLPPHSPTIAVTWPGAQDAALVRPFLPHLHLAPDPEQTRDLVQSGAIAAPMTMSEARTYSSIAARVE